MARDKTRNNSRSRSANPRGNAEPSPALRMLVRVLLVVLVLSTAAVLLVGSVFGIRYAFFLGNPYFTITELRVSPSDRLPESVIREILKEEGIAVGDTNLFAVDTRAIRRRLERAAVVRRAFVVRELPGTLVIDLKERRPVAKLRCRPPRFIDADGFALPWWESPDTRLLPDITGIRNPGSLRPGKPVEDETVLGALSFLQQVRTRPEGRSYDVATIQIDYYLPALNVYLRKRGIFGRGAVIIVPVNEMEAALDRLREIVRVRSAAGPPIELVDVTYERNCRVIP